MKGIPVDRLQNKTDIGLQIKPFRRDDSQRREREIAGAHRDDHYIFFLLTSGKGTLMVDFKNIVVSTGQLYYIMPSQVHNRIITNRAEGWFLAVDSSLISADLKDSFEQNFDVQLPCKLTGYAMKNYTSLLELLHKEFNDRKNDKYYRPVIHALTQSFLAMAASSYNAVKKTDNQPGRAVELSRQFKSLLSRYSHTIKRPSAYASKLNVSTGYLNEAVKKVTGSTVSYWIQQELFTEAKRMLYHLDVDVKQVAYELGFDDYSYFIRSFGKVCGVSPARFRLLNRS